MTDETSPEAAGAADRVSQLRRGLTVLEFLSSGAASGASVARELGVNRSTAMRLLQELEEAGYVSRPDGRRFELSTSRLLRLAARPGSIDGTEAVQELLATLREDYGEATVLGAPSHDSMVYISFYPSRHAVAVREQMGTTRPMHASALGKAYLSALDSEVLELELGRLRYVGGTVTAAANADELRRRVQQVKERGYAIGAIGVSGPSHRISAGFIEEVAQRLLV